MSLIESSLHQYFLKYADKNILIAYSGGVDSQVLLHCLALLKKQKRLTGKLSVCHVDHGLSVNSLQWQAFAKEQCQKLHLPLKVISVNVQAKVQKSLEALARDARYAALKSEANSGDLIVTGHHSDDQAETYLLALKRGSGLKGLSAMQSEMPLGEQILVRPLLNISRKDIEAYAKEHQLTWIEDESNTDERFDRNFLRHQVLPKLNKRWPSFNKTVARSAEHCFEAQQLLNELAEQDYIACQLSSHQLSISYLHKLSDARLKNLLRYFLAINKVLMPSRSQLTQICQQLNADADKSPVVQLANCCLRRYRDELHLTDVFQDISTWQEEVDISILLEQELMTISLPDGLGTLNLSFNTLDEKSGTKWQVPIKNPSDNQKVTIGFVHQNPKCLPDYRQHSRSLKKILQELDIPTWQRKRSPFLFYDNELVAVVGHFVCKAFVADNDDQALLLSWQAPHL